MSRSPRTILCTHLLSTPNLAPISVCFISGFWICHSHMRRRSSSVSVFLGCDAIGGAGCLGWSSVWMPADAAHIATGADELKPLGFVNMLGHVGWDGTISMGSVG